ncbi:MAG: hypothetical protein IJV44_12760 [Prevotella sp.]|nr:hypothetical protein [Prevotella sp.]
MIERIDQILTKKIKIDQIHLVVSVGSLTFAEKMSNPAFMSVVFEGDRRELRSLYGKMNVNSLSQKASNTILCINGRMVYQCQKD